MAETPKAFAIITVYKDVPEEERAKGVGYSVIDTECKLVPGGVIYMDSPEEAKRLASLLRRAGVNAYEKDANPISYTRWLEFNSEELVAAAVMHGKAAKKQRQ